MTLLGCLLMMCKPNLQDDFTQSLTRTLSKGIVTDADFHLLEVKLSKLPNGWHSKEGQMITTPEALAGYIVSQGITENAKVLRNSLAPFAELQIMLENSESMKGYMSTGNPKFTSPIISLFNAVEEDTRVETGYVHEQDGTAHCIYEQIDKEVFQSSLANGKVSTALSSPIDQILSLMAEYVTDSTVFALITDGLVSGTNKEILSTLPRRDWTINNLPILENRIRQAMKQVREKDLDFIIYRFMTTFNGTYYDYKNLKHSFKNVDRPYYIIMVGAERHLASMDTRLKQEDFHPTNSLRSYNFSGLPVVEKGVIAAIPVPGVKSTVKTILPLSEFSFTKPATAPFDFKCRIIVPAEMPTQYTTPEFLKENLKFDYTDEQTKVLVDKGEMIINVLAVDGAPNTFDVIFQVDPSFIGTISGKRKMHLYLPVAMDNWYDTLSEEDDSNDSTADKSKTFQLSYFIGGFLKGFDLKNAEQNIIDINITLSK